MMETTPHSLSRRSSSCSSKQDVVVQLSAPAELRRQNSGASAAGLVPCSELTAALKARYNSGSFAEPAPEPEARSCGKDVFKRAIR